MNRLPSEVAAKREIQINAIGQELPAHAGEPVRV